MKLQRTQPPLILASASPTRAGLMCAAGLAFETRTPFVDETSIRQSLRSEALPTGDASIAIADIKARSVVHQVDNDALVLAADQLLDLEGEWLEKPKTKDSCRSHLK